MIIKKRKINIFYYQHIKEDIMGEKMYYILKIIQENENSAISAKEILKRLENYNIYIDIKTVYSCIKQINKFFYFWIEKK